MNRFCLILCLFLNRNAFGMGEERKAKYFSFSYTAQIKKDIPANIKPIAKLFGVLIVFSSMVATVRAYFQQANHEKIISLFSQTLNFSSGLVLASGLFTYSKHLSALKSARELEKFVCANGILFGRDVYIATGAK